MPKQKLLACFAFTALTCAALSVQSAPTRDRVGGWRQTDFRTGLGLQDAAKNTASGHLRSIPSKHSGSPVVGEFQGKQESSEDQTRRQIRERRYGVSRSPGRIFDPGALVNGDSVTTDLTFIDYVTRQSSDPHGIPVSSSTAIVIATVISGECFVSGDRSVVYTDYRLQIDEVLKPDPATNLRAGVQVTGSRPGGAIHFPSGHVTRFFDAGHGFPAIGSKYVLFLWRSIQDLPEYEIVFAAGYEVKANRVYPLDDMNSEYDGMSFPPFLSMVQTAIASSQNEGAKP